MTEAGRRLYAMLGRLPDGLALEDAGRVLPGEGDDAAARLLRARLARPAAGRVRMLAPVREHAAGVALGEEDAGRLVAHFVALARALP